MWKTTAVSCISPHRRTRCSACGQCKVELHPMTCWYGKNTLPSWRMSRQLANLTARTTIMLAGDYNDFVLEAGIEDRKAMRPLYLRPFSSTFAANAINSILITSDVVYLVQCTLGSHLAVKKLLFILQRLVKLGLTMGLLPVSYLVVGSQGSRVRNVVRAVQAKLADLVPQVNAAVQRPYPKKRCPELAGMPKRVVERIQLISPQGVVFDPVQNTPRRM
ncbi:hypothetical protein FB45DRAFT_915721 [Roridomyces roridus]|uniref:Uncharacterized protein n=1 Tax=Roridomyces roridus TaxID=1738132 RepID=A0AAD7BU03_9AGAR|nr:hypothetical protein FB45DRAFT_915721 [Roridomyces roridus]